MSRIPKSIFYFNPAGVRSLIQKDKTIGKFKRTHLGPLSSTSNVGSVVNQSPLVTYKLIGRDMCL